MHKKRPAGKRAGAARAAPEQNDRAESVSRADGSAAAPKETLAPPTSVRDAAAGEVERPEASPAFPVVGVGASAGGLDAFTRFLRALAPDTGMAFVLVQHLSPTHESVLAEILTRATTMTVKDVQDESEILPNHVYVLPPNRNVVIAAGHLRLLEREAHGKQHPIDQFFVSLARAQRERAIGVVLSGTATDGTLGLEEIKAEGGITFAQDDSAEQPGMPESAVASGCVDFVLSPSDIAAEIGRIAAHPYVASGAKRDDPVKIAGDGKQGLLTILQILRAATDADFTQYKVSTLSRRIRRRMVLLKLKELEEYAKLLRANSAEVGALYQDILINVTGFFRDPEMFEALQEQGMRLLPADRSREDPLRVWVLGCSTGEEAYSLAILFTEALERAGCDAPVQIFATDLNAAGVDRARAGVYPKERLEEVSRERLRRFFVEQDGKYRVAKPVRDMCVFSRHDVLSDPPFSRMDVVSCRNLLIYLEPQLQQRIIPLLHYALKPQGLLVLGSSETVGPFRDLFTPEEPRHKIFAKRPSPVRMPLFPPIPRARTAPRPDVSRAPVSKAARTPQVPLARVPVSAAVGGADRQKEAERFLVSLAPPSVLVDASFEILSFRGNTEPYLVPPQGKATHSLLKMARGELLVPLEALLRRAKKENARVREDGLRIRVGGRKRALAIEVVPLADAEREACFLVLFDEAPVLARSRKSTARAAASTPTESPAADSARLEQELASTRDYLQALVEQHESTTEELQSANEESQSTNEELQSINEELETSKEEIQSSNEELTTLNEELHNRNLELGQVNNDLANLISSVQVAIVIVGRDLRIRRFSPVAEKLLNLIPGDVGRPITDNRMLFAVPDLDALLLDAIDTVASCEREMQGRDGRWYALRIRPYLTLEKAIDGAVLMLVDIDSIRRAREYAECVIATVQSPLLVLDAGGRVRTANGAFYETFGVAPPEVVGHVVYEICDREWDVPKLRTLFEDILLPGSTLANVLVEHDFERVGRKVMRINARTLVIPGEEQPSRLVAIEDVTLLLDSEEQLRQSERRYRSLFATSRDGILVVDPKTQRILDSNPSMTELFGHSYDELVGKELFQLGLFEDERGCREALERLDETHALHREDLALTTKHGERRDVEIVGNLYVEKDVGIIQCNVRDITERKEIAAELEASKARYSAEATALARLNELSAKLWRIGTLREGLDEILDAAMELLGATLGNVQLLDARRGVLLIASQRGFQAEFLEYFREVSAEHDSACGRALRSGQRIVVEDVEADATYARKHPIARAAGYRAVQSTPLIGRDGQALGMVSTHFAAAHRPSEQELRRLDLYLRQASDFIQRCRLEEELQARVDELAAVDRGKNNFLAMLSHELRSPLNAIRGWVELLKRPSASQELIGRGIDVIDRQSQAQADLIADLMDIQRLATGKTALATADVELVAVIAAVTDAVMPIAMRKGISIRQEIEAGDVVVFGDEKRLHQVLWNLFSNAIKFAPTDGKISLVLRRTEARVEVEISDNGEGIPPEVLPQIFEPFRQGDPAASRAHVGLGLGLSIVKQLVELHGGAVRAESPGKGKGATFTITLPLRSADAPRRPKTLQTTSGSVDPALHSLRGVLTLVVDDDVDAREPLRRVLEAAGGEVITVGSAEEALAVLRERRPDVLLSDIGLPGRDGYELVRSLRGLPGDAIARVPAVAVTAYASAEDRQRALRAGYDAHFGKPVDSAELVGAVADLVAATRGVTSERDHSTRAR